MSGGPLLSAKICYPEPLKPKKVSRPIHQAEGHLVRRRSHVLLPSFVTIIPCLRPIHQPAHFRPPRARHSVPLYLSPRHAPHPIHHARFLHGKQGVSYRLTAVAKTWTVPCLWSVKPAACCCFHRRCKDISGTLSMERFVCSVLCLVCSH